MVRDYFHKKRISPIYIANITHVHAYTSISILKSSDVESKNHYVMDSRKIVSPGEKLWTQLINSLSDILLKKNFLFAQVAKVNSS